MPGSGENEGRRKKNKQELRKGVKMAKSIQSFDLFGPVSQPSPKVIVSLVRECIQNLSFSLAVKHSVDFNQSFSQ